MIHKLLAALCALFVGGWMLTDGIHCLLRGKYIGPEKPGPWSALFTLFGINPFSVAPPFIALGVAWIVSLIFLVIAPPSLAHAAWIAALIIAIASLWYLPVGTVFSAAYILLLIFGRVHF